MLLYISKSSDFNLDTPRTPFVMKFPHYPKRLGARGLTKLQRSLNTFILLCVRVKRFKKCTCIINSDFFSRAFRYLLLQSLVKGGRRKAALVGSLSAERWPWAGGRRPRLAMLDRLLHLCFQAPWLRPILSSVTASRTGPLHADSR